MVAVVAAGAMLLGVSGGVSASAVQNNAPYTDPYQTEPSCLGVVNSFMASEIRLIPAETVALYPEWFASVQELEELQRSCDEGFG